MKKQTTAIFGRSHFKSVVLAVLLFVGVVPFLARSHGQSEGGTVLAGRIGASGVVTSSKNPLQIALLHWYNANLTTQFTVGTSPYGMAFDGANIWVANNSGGSVTEIRASDGSVLNNFAFSYPSGVAFDGTHIWVSSNLGNSVYEVDPSNGNTVGTFGGFSQANMLAFDGASVWVLDFGSAQISKF